MLSALPPQREWTISYCVCESDLEGSVPPEFITWVYRYLKQKFDDTIHGLLHT